MPGLSPGAIVPPLFTRSKLIVSALSTPPVKLNEPPSPLLSVFAVSLPPLRFSVAVAAVLAPIDTSPLPGPCGASSTLSQPPVMLSVALLPGRWPTRIARVLADRVDRDAAAVDHGHVELRRLPMSRRVGLAGRRARDAPIGDLLIAGIRAAGEHDVVRRRPFGDFVDVLFDVDVSVVVVIENPIRAVRPANSDSARVSASQSFGMPSLSVS